MGTVYGWQTTGALMGTSVATSLAGLIMFTTGSYLAVLGLSMAYSLGGVVGYRSAGQQLAGTDTGLGERAARRSADTSARPATRTAAGPRCRLPPGATGTT